MNTQMRHKYQAKRYSQRGFSLFELLVYILIASILFVAAANRYREYSAEAERANFLAVLAQLKAGVNLQMMRMIADAAWSESKMLDGTNPMDLMLEVPSNYLGESSSVDVNKLSGNLWYFDNITGELVYVANQNRNLYLLDNGQRVETRQLRFRIESIHTEVSSAQPGQWQGLLLNAVVPYEWHSAPVQELAVNVP